MTMSFLHVSNLSVSYGGSVPAVAVQRVSFDLDPGESMGLVGESGCGKSTLASALLGLLPAQARAFEGSILLDGVEQIGLDPEAARRKRWSTIAYVPQSASTSLSPVTTLFNQFRQTWAAHRAKDDQELRRLAEELFRAVELDVAWLDAFPHQLSGGMRQRAIIALSLLFSPSLLIADEPTTGLDVLVQRQVIDVLKRLQSSKDMALVFVSHDIAVVSELCRKLSVMYAGRIVEIGLTHDVMSKPLHPYTIALKQAFPDIGQPEKKTVSIPGRMPLLADVPVGCAFAARCPFRTELCLRQTPELRETRPGQWAACHYSEDADAMTAAIASGNAWREISVVD